MERRILDTSILIAYWRQRRSGSRREITPRDVARWAKDLIDLYRTDAIVTPVYVELLAGITDRYELRLTQTFLASFRCVDGGNITPADWQDAIRLAQRVPRNRKPRQLGDCLIRAVANRLRYGVETLDQDFPK
jgi:predicted nucleic acid-binding protein